MNHFCRKVLLLTLFCTALLAEAVHGQSSSINDSIRHLLTYFHENTKDEKLKQAIKEAQAIYTGDTMNDSLAKKLLKVDDFLVDALRPDRQMILSYTEKLTRLLKQLPPIQEHPFYAKSLNNLGILYRAIGQYEKALPLFQQALAISKKVLGEEHPDYAIILSTLAGLYYFKGQYEKALPLSQQALAIRKKVLGEGHTIYAESLTHLAILYYGMGQYEKALPLYKQALAIYKKVLGEEHPIYAGSLNNLAILFNDMGQYEKALFLYQQASAIYKKVLGEEHPLYALSLTNLAILYKVMGQYEKALPLHQQVLAITKKVLGEEHPDYAHNLNNLAALFSDMGQYEKALPLYQQALAITKKVQGEEHPDYAHNLNNLAALFSDMGQYEKALPLIQQALAIIKKVLGEEDPYYAQNLNDLGLLYSTLGNHTEAYTLLSKAAELKIHHLNQTYSTLSEQEKQNFLKNESDQFFYLPSLLFTQKTTQPSLANQSYTNELTLKGMVLENQQQVLNSIRKSGDSTTLQLYEQWQLNRTLIGKQLLLPIKDRLPYLDSLQDATNQQEQQLSRSAAAFRNQQLQRNKTAKDIASKLTNGQASIEFIRFRLFNPKKTDSILYAALVLLPRDTAAHFVPLFEEKQLQRLLKPLSSKSIYKLYPAIQKLYGRNSKSAPGISQYDLYQLLWKPLEKFLTGIHTVYYAPAGLLHRVAFQALSPGPGHSLIDQYQLHQVLSTRFLVLPAQTTATPLSASLWGNIDYNPSRNNNNLATGNQRTGSLNTAPDTTASSFNFYTWDTKALRSGGGDLKPLPATKKEIDSLDKLLTKVNVPVTVSSGAAATEETFKALDGKSPQVLHLATHGFFLPVAESKPKHGLEQMGGSAFTVQQNPLFRNGLALAGANPAWKGKATGADKEDGILTAYEIAQMGLSGTDVVVLSACETALGDVRDNEGVIGLQRAFKLAG